MKRYREKLVFGAYREWRGMPVLNTSEWHSPVRQYVNALNKGDGQWVVLYPNGFSITMDASLFKERYELVIVPSDFNLKQKEFVK